MIYQFFAGFSSEFAESAWTLREVFAITTQLFLAFGVGFELPVVIFFLALASGVVEPRTPADAAPSTACWSRSYLGAVLTPAGRDEHRSCSPCRSTLLYMLGVAAAFLFSPRRKPAEVSTPSALTRDSQTQDRALRRRSPANRPRTRPRRRRIHGRGDLHRGLPMRALGWRFRSCAAPPSADSSAGWRAARSAATKASTSAQHGHRIVQEGDVVSARACPRGGR